MRTNLIAAAGAAIVVILLAFLFLRVPTASAPAAAPETASSTAQTSAASSTPSDPSKPTFHMGTPEKVKVTVAFDAKTFASTSAYPTVTGTATNATKVGIVIYNPEGVAVSGTTDIPVKDGHWSYAVSVALQPGTYTLVLTGGDELANATLTVSK